MNLAALSDLLESADSSFDCESLQRIGAQLPQLLASGFAREIAPATDIVCLDCDTPHVVPVFEQAGTYRSFCAGGAGQAAVEAQALRRFEFDARLFMGALARSFGLARASEELAPGLCWRLGTARIADADVVVLLALKMDDPRRVVEIAGVLKRRLMAGKGLILCGVRPLVDLGLFPKGVRAIALTDALNIDETGAMSVNERAVVRTLGIGRRKHGEHGAPTAHPKLIARVEARLASGQAESRDRAEARYLLSEAAHWAEPGEPLPALDALRMLVARRRRSGGF